MHRLAAIVLCLLAMTTPGVALSAEPRAAAVTLTILHTNDIHGHLTAWRGWEGELTGKTVGGFDRLATAVNQARTEAGPGNVLLLDAGDAIGDTMIADLTKGRALPDA